MARCVFFSFHYSRDVWRVNQIRNSWVTQQNRSAGFIDAADFEAVRRRGESAVRAWIDRQLNGTTVTAVLIGQQTASRDYVHYEIERSVDRDNGFVPIYIHKLRNQKGETNWFAGDNPLEQHEDEENSSFFWSSTFADRYPAYDWVDDDGYENFGDWVEEAYRIARD